MKYLAEKFLSQSDREKIRSAVKEAEKETSGEIVPMVVTASYHYPVAGIMGAAAFSFPTALILTMIICGLLWLGSQNMWLFIGLFTGLFLLSRLIIDRVPAIKRLFIFEREIEQEVEEAAVTAFFQNGLHRTKDETGVLLFISLFEHKVHVLADRGINAKVEKEAWKKIVDHIVHGIKNKHQGQAICEAVTMTGDLLKTHFHIKHDDVNELKNLIVEE